MPNTTKLTETQEKPNISLEVDIPFQPDESRRGTIEDVPSLIKYKDQQHNHEVEDFKNAIGKKLLYGCLITIIVFALIDARYHVDAPMFTSAFEVVKIVSTTVLGYLFGSKTKS